jgi:LysR family transcriptional regulator, glycine cleavage system transcriptional activator
MVPAAAGRAIEMILPALLVSFTIGHVERLPSMLTLQAFEAAARHGSYSRAASELNVTHGAISHRIRELEDRLKVRLFQRVGHNMQPTREAVTLLAQVRHALGMLQLTFPETRRSGTKLVVGVHPAFATRWLVRRIDRFVASAPKLAVEIRTTADLGEFLAPGIDIAVRYGTGIWPNAVSERLVGEELFPVCSPEYQAQHRLQKPADLARCTLLRHLWQPWSPWLQASGLSVREPTAGLTLSDSAMLLEAAEAGQGVALARGLFARDALASGRLLRLFDLGVPDSNAYCAVWRAGTTLSPSADDFRSWLRRELAESQHLEAPEAPEPAAPVARRARRSNKTPAL